MSRRSVVPWGYRWGHSKAIGLREMLCRVAYLTEWEVREIVKYPKADLYVVATWRIETPARFAELLRIMRISIMPHPDGRQRKTVVRVTSAA